MKAHWITAALLTSALATACNQNPPYVEENKTAAPESGSAGEVDPAPQTSAAPVSPNGDTAARTDTRPLQAPSGTRTSGGSKAAGSSTEGDRVKAADERPAAPAAPRVEYRELKVPVGTALPLELLTPLSSETAQIETAVRARLKQGISVDGYPLLPAGTELSGTVTEVGQAGRVKGRARLAIVFTEATIDGARQKLRTNPITFEAEASRGEDATKIGAGAGIGAVIGGILGGGSGAAKGAAIGGAAGTGAVLATKGKDVNVAAGADLAATLAEPFEVRVRVQ